MPAVVVVADTSEPPAPVVALMVAPASPVEVKGAALEQAGQNEKSRRVCKDIDLQELHNTFIVGSMLEENCQTRLPPCGQFFNVSELLT